MSILKVNSIEPANAGSEDYFLAKVWINYDQTIPAISASGKVSSITDDGVGVFNINFSNAFSSANYASLEASNAAQNRCGFRSENTTLLLRHVCENDSGTNIDNQWVTFGIIA